MSRVRSWFENPWGRPRFLWAVGVGYVLWTLIPVVVAVVFSFNSTRSTSFWTGFSLRWWLRDPNDSIVHSPELLHDIAQSVKLAAGAALVSVPLGVAFALGLHRWRGKAASSANFIMMFSFITPELILAVSLFLLFTTLFAHLPGLGSWAQLAGLVVLALAYPVVIVRARLLSIGREYEEAAMDLGASPVQALRRVTVPLLYPAIFASAAIIFAFSLDDFVIVNQLARDSSQETVAMFIYSSARTSPLPNANAVGTLMLVTSTMVIIAAYLVYRRMIRRTVPGAEAPSAAIAMEGLPV